MFSKILIANRGEIACRIIKSARAMGIETVAVFSDADHDALHVGMADEAVRIGPAPAAQSYLSIEAILEACRATGADAVHPGYGFLSEQAAFARALEAEGVAFIGPNVRAIEVMGDKITSKRAAMEAGVSTVPGFVGVIEDAAHARQLAEEIGYPVMLKASAGGGGKGMRIAHNATEVEDGLARARSEAKASFNDDRVFLEKYIVEPRHIEIQVIGDKQGNVIFLGERECSLQRRHQKVIEEAPSPLLDEETRAAMGAQAVALARMVDYDSAGTVEFVVSQDKKFYFLEMNTRLQVEHPVTELVTGLDLVELMIRSAAGERLPLTQQDVRMQGWAVEARIYAEDPERGFLPSTGRLVKYAPPNQNECFARQNMIHALDPRVKPGDDGCGWDDRGSHAQTTIRVDTGVVEGGEISRFYDPMIAKLVTYGADRAVATAAMAQALDEFAIRGIRHNISFLSALMRHPRWRDGRLSTGLIGEEFPLGFIPPAPEGEEAFRMAAVAAQIDHALNTRKRQISGQLPGRHVTFNRRRVVMLGEARHEVRLFEDGERLAVQFLDSDEQEIRTCVMLSSWRPGEVVWRGAVDGEALSMQVLPLLNGVELAHRGFATRALVYTRREAELAALMPPESVADNHHLLRCPMPGLVMSVAVEEGQEIKTGEPIAVVEAMKMENVLRAQRDGRIKAVRVRAGESVAVDAVVVEFA